MELHKQQLSSERLIVNHTGDGGQSWQPNEGAPAIDYYQPAGRHRQGRSDVSRAQMIAINSGARARAQVA